MRRFDAKGFSYLLAAACIVVAWVVLAWPWLSGAVTIPYDAKAHFQAQLQFLANALHSGQSPFWTHNVFAGSPQIADPQSLIFSPAIILAFFSAAPSFQMVDAYVLLHLLAGGLGLMMFFRDRGWHPAAAVLAAIVFAFGASAAWRIQHVGQIASLGFFGICLWLTARMLLRNSLLWGAIAGIAAGFMMLEPDQVALLGAYVLVAMVVAHWISGGWPAFRASLGPIAMASVAGIATVTLPLLWIYLFAESSVRPEIGFTEAAKGSLHPVNLLTAVVADLFGARDQAVHYWGPYSEWWPSRGGHLSQNMTQVYFGALPLLLIIVPGLTRGWLFDREIRLFTILFGFMLLFALGQYTPAFSLFYDYLPGVKVFRRPADATFLIGALGAVLAGYVLHRLLAAKEDMSLRRDLVIGGALIAAVFAVSVAVAMREGHIGDAWWPLLSSAFWFAGGVALLAAAMRWRVGFAPVAAIVLVAGLVGADLKINNGPNESTALSPELFDVLRPDTRNETVAVLKLLVEQPAGSPRRDRVELLGMGFEWPNAGLVHGFDHTLGYNPLRLADFSDAVGTRDSIANPRDRKFTPLFPSYRSRLADAMGLRYIATPVPVEQVDKALRPGDLRLIARTRNSYIYENERALPRVQFVGGWRAADFEDMKETGNWPDVDPDQIVLLDVAPSDGMKPGATASQGAVKLLRYENTEVEIEVTATEPGFVVLNDVWHPWWHAQVDGTETEILKANVLFRAVQVPAGTHRVTFTFNPVAGALAEFRERIAPEEETSVQPASPQPNVPLTAGTQAPHAPALSGPSQAVRGTLGLGSAPASNEPRPQVSTSRAY